MIKKQFTLYLRNKPGELARVTRLLAKARLNIEGVSASGSADIGLMQIVVSNASAARKVLTKAAIPFVAQDVLLVPLRNEPGALARVAENIARRGININYVYATACGCGRDCRCYAIISAPDLKQAAAACAE